MSPQLAALMPDLKKGARAAIATVIPFFLARRFERPELAWVALGGWFAVLADPGGAVRARADAMAVFLVAATAAIVAGTSVSASPIASTIWIGAVTWLAASARSFGGVATNLGTVIAIIATIATAGRTPAAIASILFGIGVVWATAMSTLVWPGRPQLPLQHAVARAYNALAEYADAVVILLADGDARHDSWVAMTRLRQRPVRSALEEARTVMIELRARHTGETAVGANTRALLGEAELQFNWLIAYADELEHETKQRAFAADIATLEELASGYRAVRAQLLTRRASPRNSRPAVASQNQLAIQLLEASRGAVELSRDLGTLPAAATSGVSRAATLATSTALTLRSPVFRHAFRVSVATVTATIVGRFVSPEHWQWAVITAIGVLQPYLGPTLVRVVERVVGTILGVVIAVGVIFSIESPIAIAIVMFPLVLISVVTRPRSYRLFVLFLTPVFVLVADSSHPDISTTLDRILDVALGGAIAIGVAILIPSWERERLPDATAAALDALAEYVRVAFEVVEHGGDRERLRLAGRDVGVALENAEASLERMLAEPRAFRRGVDRSVFTLTYARRVTSALTALDEMRAASATPSSMPSTDDVRDYLLAAIQAAKRFITTGQSTELHEPSSFDPSLARFVHQADLLATGRPRAMAS